MRPSARLLELERLDHLRRRRLDLARTALAAAAVAVVTRRDSLLSTEGRIAALDRARADLDGWLAERPQAPLIACAMARQGALRSQRLAELGERERNLAALAEAEAARTRAAAALSRAQARLDGASRQLAVARRARAAAREAVAEAEFDGRSGNAVQRMGAL